MRTYACQLPVQPQTGTTFFFFFKWFWSQGLLFQNILCNPLLAFENFTLASTSLNVIILSVAQVFPFQWSGFPSKYCSLGNLSLIVYFSWPHHLLIVNEPPSVFVFFIFHIGAMIMSSEGCRRWHHLHCSPCLIGSRALLIAFLQRSQPRPLHPSQPRPFHPISFCCHPAFINYGAKCPLPSLFHAADGSWSSGVVLLRNQWLLWHIQW